MKLWKEETLNTAEYRIYKEQIQMKTSLSLFFRRESYQDPLLNGLHRDPPKQSLQFAK